MGEVAVTVTRDQLLESFAVFIATTEGFFVPNSLPARHHNPGDLVSWGSWPVENGYVVFDNDESGWKALKKQSSKNIFDRKLTFLEFFAGQRDEAGALKLGGYPGFCPAPTGSKLTKGNDPHRYASDAVLWVNHKLGAAAGLGTVISSLVQEKS